MLKAAANKSFAIGWADTSQSAVNQYCTAVSADVILVGIFS